jgi:hypothetical protein
MNRKDADAAARSATGIITHSNRSRSLVGEWSGDTVSPTEGDAARTRRSDDNKGRRCLVRLVRLGTETSQIGPDVRAALSSWGPGTAVLGGIALLGVTPLGCPRPVEAVILLPRGVVVVVGVDLPDPALRLDAPLDAQWKVDGWPLVNSDGAVNPAVEALAAAASVTNYLQDRNLDPIPVSTVVAVGPYVGQVTQSTVDLHQRVRVLHPGPKPLLSAMRELAVADRACSVDQARRLLTELVGNRAHMMIGEVAAEGFVDAVTPDLATANTTLIPKITDRTVPPKRAGRSSTSPRPGPGRRGSGRVGGRTPRWLPMAALGLLAVLLIAGVAVAVGTMTRSSPAAAAGPTTTPVPDVLIGGVSFGSEGSVEGSDCASHAYGDIQVWLTRHVCSDMIRSVYRTSSGGRAAGVSVAVVSFADAATAKAFGTEANTPGTGGITDLVQEDGGWVGGPKSFDNAAYTVVVLATSVRLTEVVWAGPGSSPSDPDLMHIAAVSAGLPSGQ